MSLVCVDMVPVLEYGPPVGGVGSRGAAARCRCRPANPVASFYDAVHNAPPQPSSACETRRARPAISLSLKSDWSGNTRATRKASARCCWSRTRRAGLSIEVNGVASTATAFASRPMSFTRQRRPSCWRPCVPGASDEIRVGRQEMGRGASPVCLGWFQSRRRLIPSPGSALIDWSAKAPSGAWSLASARYV
jgi:hypothetical protein